MTFLHICLRALFCCRHFLPVCDGKEAAVSCHIPKCSQPTRCLIMGKVKVFWVWQSQRGRVEANSKRPLFHRFTDFWWEETVALHMKGQLGWLIYCSGRAFVSPNTLLENTLKTTCRYQRVQHSLDFNPIENLWEELKKKKQAFKPDSISLFQ